jgi:hypothetical protein
MYVISAVICGKQSLLALWVSSDLIEIDNGIKNVPRTNPVVVFLNHPTRFHPIRILGNILSAKRKQRCPKDLYTVLVSAGNELRCSKG